MIHIDKSNQYTRNNNNPIDVQILHKYPLVSDMEDSVHASKDREEEEEEEEMLLLALSLTSTTYQSNEKENKSDER